MAAAIIVAPSSTKQTKSRSNLKQQLSDSLPWSEPLSGDDPFALLAGGTEGGVPIVGRDPYRWKRSTDQSTDSSGGYQNLWWKKKAQSKKSNKWTRVAGDGEPGFDSDGSCVIQAGGDGEAKPRKKKQKRKSMAKKVKKRKGEAKEAEEAAKENDTQELEIKPVEQSVQGFAQEYGFNQIFHSVR